MDSVPEGHKRCALCEQILPASDFYVKDKRTGRLSSYCKKCHVADTLRRYHADPKAGHARTAAWRAANPERERENTRKYRETHREQIRASGAKHDAKRASTRQERQSTARYKDTAKAYRETHPDEERARAHNTRARAAGAEGTITGADIRALMALYKHQCLRCGRGAPAVTLTLDHVIPLTKGGSNTPDNCQVLCHSCNSFKNNGTADYRR